MIETTKAFMGRKELQQFAFLLRSSAAAQQAMDNARSPTDRSTVGLCHLWAKWGAQSVIMPHTFAAALMASESRGAIEGQQLPWPAFEIQVPRGLLHSSHGEVVTVLICEIPSTITVVGKYLDHRLCVGYLDTQSWGVNTYRDVGHMLNEQEVNAYYDDPDRDLSPGLAEDFDADVEFRLWKMLARLIAGVVLTINTARIDKPTAFPTRPPHVKRDELRANTVQIGAPLKIDCRQVISDYMSGNRRSSPALTFLVRGHWRNQAYGPQRALRRPLWIHPHYKGEGPMAIRPTHIGGEP